MREEGISTFSVDESGWCLDRWAGLESVITPARQLFDRIPAVALLTQDRGFFGDADWKDLMARKIQRLVRVKNSLVRKKVRVLSDGGAFAQWGCLHVELQSVLER